MADTKFDLRERRAIEDMLNARIGTAKIAAHLGRHRSSAFREIECNRYGDTDPSHFLLVSGQPRI